MRRETKTSRLRRKSFVLESGAGKQEGISGVLGTRSLRYETPIDLLTDPWNLKEQRLSPITPFTKSWSRISRIAWVTSPRRFQSSVEALFLASFPVSGTAEEPAEIHPVPEVIGQGSHEHALAYTPRRSLTLPHSSVIILDLQLQFPSSYFHPTLLTMKPFPSEPEHLGVTTTWKRSRPNTSHGNGPSGENTVTMDSRNDSRHTFQKYFDCLLTRWPTYAQDAPRARRHMQMGPKKTDSPVPLPDTNINEKDATVQNGGKKKGRSGFYHVAEKPRGVWNAVHAGKLSKGEQGSIETQPSKATPEEWRTSGVQTVREDSRYTWNSGSSSIPYISRNRDNIRPFVERNHEVSVDKTRKPRPPDVQRPGSNNFWDPSSPRLKNSGRIIDKSIVKTDQQITNIFHVHPVKNGNLTRLRNTFRRHSIGQTSKGTILGDSSRSSTNSSSKRSDEKLNSVYTHVPLLNSGSSHPKRVTIRLNSTKNGPSRGHVRDSLSRRTNEITMNNSRSNVATMGRNPEFSNQKIGTLGSQLSSNFDGIFAKVEATTPFNHVAAIKKITNMLTHEQSNSRLPLENKNSVDYHVGIPLVSSSQGHSNRYSNPKHSNRTRIRRPGGHLSNPSKKNQNKVNSNKTHANKGNSSNPNSNLKNWPNGAIQNADDFHNYDKYTSMGDDPKPEEAVQRPLPLKNSSFNYHVPISSPSLQEIVHWLKIPAFMTNGNHVIETDHINGPVSVAFDPIYQNLEPNKPSKPSDIQIPKPGFIRPLRPPSYSTGHVPNWSGTVPSRNKTQRPVIYNPQTQVSQNTVVHLINTDSKKPNKTIVGSKIPAGFIKPIVSDVFVPSSGSTSSSVSSAPTSYPPSLISSQLYPYSTTTSKPGPNVHIGFTSYEESNKVSDQQAPQTPVVTYDQRCPTILINSYTRINNTIQSKDGCTDLNIIINSHVFNANVYKSTPSPVTDQVNPEDYQTYGEVDKYAPGSQVSSGTNYQPTPVYQYNPPGSPQWPQGGYYDSQVDPEDQSLYQNDVSNLEVIQDTQISISSSSEEVSSPVESSLTELEEPDSLGHSPGVNSLVRPAVAPAGSASGSPGSSPVPPAGLVVGSSPPTRPIDDDDDDDDFDLSPTGIMDSITSVFTYFTFINPLHYGFFSVAAAPFTALAAGVLGIVTFIYPWLFPSSFGFSRASSNAGDSIWSNLEEVVRQSMENDTNDRHLHSPQLPETIPRLNFTTPLFQIHSKVFPKFYRQRESTQLNGTQRHLKDLQHIDQSLRTVATQLLNVTNHEEPPKIIDNVIKKPVMSYKPIERNEATPIKEIHVNNGQAVNSGFGRPINSKFSYFETSHPGQAMAITEEELEREMISTRLMSAYKNHPTTTGGISTWILLNPPSTTMKTEIEKKTKEPFETEVKLTVKSTTLMERVDTTERVTEKATVPASTTIAEEETPTTRKPLPVSTKKTIEAKLNKTQSTEKVEPIQSTTLKVPQTTMSNLESKESTVSVTKKVQLVRTTPKPKIATMKTTVLSKPMSKNPRPNQQNRPKPPARRTTVKPDIVKSENASTAKIEKVTFRPVQMFTIPKNKIDSTEKPMFVTKIKASILMDTQKTTVQPPVSATPSLELNTTSKSTTADNNLVELSVKPKPIGTKVNNVLKVQLKKPLDEATKVEVESIKVNTPVLKIEKVEKEDIKKEETEKETESMDNTRIDLMKRRKPASSTTTTTATSLVQSTTETELIADESVAENGIQESKIVPETKVATNWTKTKKKPASTPISMQIYNFLSREVMPSFGVMSLVGLGLGLASYFLYPFGGTVTRRNYEVEPKYKYNFDEYGGNYGQSEEEVLSKVLQGMTTDETKYPGSKDYDNNYYRYQHYDGGFDSQTSKKNDQRYSSSSPMYRPDNTASVLKYRNTDYRYSDTPSTPNYYDRSKHREYVVGSALPGSANRQFVVGSIPKEYPPYEDKLPALSTPGKLANSYEPTESGQIQFDRDINQNFNYPMGSVQNFGQVQTARPDETYEEVEITPTAVAVEHGPRSLKIKRSLPNPANAQSTKIHHSRRKRDSNTVEWIELTTKKPVEQNGFNLFSFVKKIAEIKFRLGLTLLKHASEGFARYLGHVQKRINGEE
ncbi:hypothetical protein WN48_00754 [Eufriesea mexicana]|uniref:Uncharacterized protein n=1 Tax=Eufriesea mexicana TaxID=516756 RepID=A0A310S581_9HYME|nr:hypothetical protein WN48_00754 [Eufriesea mexicana]